MFTRLRCARCGGPSGPQRSIVRRPETLASADATLWRRMFLGLGRSSTTISSVPELPGRARKIGDLCLSPSLHRRAERSGISVRAARSRGGASFRSHRLAPSVSCRLPPGQLLPVAATAGAEELRRRRSESIPHSRWRSHPRGLGVCTDNETLRRGSGGGRSEGR